MDLDFLLLLYDGTGGYVSVYLDTSRGPRRTPRTK